MCGITSSYTCANCHTGICSLLKHSIHPMIPFEDSKCPDQTVWMRRLIWAFAARICPKTRFRIARPVYRLFTYFTTILFPQRLSSSMTSAQTMYHMACAHRAKTQISLRNLISFPARLKKPCILSNPKKHTANSPIRLNSEYSPSDYIY